MSELSTKAMQFAERMQNGPYVHLKDTRDLLTACAEQLDDNETHQESLLHLIDQKDALITELVGALESVTEKLVVADAYIKHSQSGLYNPLRHIAIRYGEEVLTKAREAGHVRKD